MKYALYTCLLFIGFLVSCTNTDKAEVKVENNEQPTDSTTETKAQDSFSDETIAFINEIPFSKYARSRSKELQWDKFTMTRFWKEDFGQASTFTPSENYFELYGKFLKYSPDSSMFIDLDSYNIDLSKDKRGQLTGSSQGPDTEVSLINRAKNEQIRLVFLGPGSSIEDASWIDNDNLILIGLQENAPGANVVVWKFNLPSKMVYVYELEDEALVKSLKNYSYKERLKGVTIQ